MESKTNLQLLCDIRWPSRANAVFAFKASCDVIISALERLEEDRGENARAYNASMSKSDLIPSLVCEHTFILAPLSKLLQTTDLDWIETDRNRNVLERMGNTMGGVRYGSSHCT